MTRLTFKHLNDGTFEIIECKKWISTKDGVSYVPLGEYEYVDFPYYMESEDLVLWQVETLSFTHNTLGIN